MMNSVKVDKARLLETLAENKAKHEAEYDEAVAAYRDKASKALTKQAKAVRDGDTLSTRVDLPEPRSYGEEYDRALAMAEWSTDESIELDEQDFNAFVLDQWAWGRQFAASTAVYNAR